MKIVVEQLVSPNGWIQLIELPTQGLDREQIKDKINMLSWRMNADSAVVLMNPITLTSAVITPAQGSIRIRLVEPAAADSGDTNPDESGETHELPRYPTRLAGVGVGGGVA